MNENDIRRYARLMQELGLTGIEVDARGNVVRLEMYSPSPARRLPEVYGAEKYPAEVGEESAKLDSSSKSEEYSHDEAGVVSINSPFVGIFYLSPAEGAAPFVKVGSHVKKGETLCIIESMKLMNEILAESDCEIVEICAENGQVVDFGHPIFKIKEGSNE